MFKSLFKHYKNKNNVLDEEEIERQLKPRSIKDSSGDGFGEETLKDCGLTDPAEWKVFEHIEHPGLYVIKNAFSNEGQRRWIHQCVAEYPSPPNRNNLAPIGLLSNNDSWFDVCLNSSERKSHIFRKLRWVTLGYHHNWDTKVYSEDRRSAFPPELATLCRTVASIAGGWKFSAEAAIVNYYYQNSTINGHVDFSEPNMEAPLLSFSFGDSAIFLIGGATQDDPASPVLIKSGDVVIMSGPSRLSIHGIPRILPATLRPWEDGQPRVFDDKDTLVREYVSLSRININVRQVLYPGETTLNQR